MSFAPSATTPASSHATVSGREVATAREKSRGGVTDPTLSPGGATPRGGTTAGRGDMAGGSAFGNATNADWQAKLKEKDAELEREREVIEREREDRRIDQETYRKELAAAQAIQRQIAAILMPNKDCDEDFDEDLLTPLNITLVARLSLPRLDLRKLDVARIAAESKALGTNTFMSPQRFHDHLQMLDKMVPWSDGSARTWIDAFFLRAAAMVPPSQSLIMSAMHAQSPGVHRPLTHCASVFSKDTYPAGLAHNLGCLASETHEGFFLAQGRQFMLGDDIERAVCDMYGAAERAGRQVLRGALTNGCDWVFLILSRNLNGHGATYKQSAIISLMERYGHAKLRILDKWPDVIALLLSTWIQRCFTDFGEEDWLIVSWP